MSSPFSEKFESREKGVGPRAAGTPREGHVEGKKGDKYQRKIFDEQMLPGRQLAAQLPAGLSGLFIGRIIGDQARFVIQVGARRLAAAAPLPHPLAVAPAVGAEQGDLLSAQRVLQSGEHGFHFVLLQLLGAHGGAAEGHDTKFRKPGGRELPRGQHG
ncbi:30S ribosomal protein S7, partial [Dysosmobacter welbionis]